jgi:hypothetical protein
VRSVSFVAACLTHNACACLTGFNRKMVKTRKPGRKRIALSPHLGRNWTMVGALNFRGIVT